MHVDNALIYANKNKNNLQKTSNHIIKKGLEELYIHLKYNKKEFSECICNEAGKPITLAEAEVSRALTCIQEAMHVISHLGPKGIPMEHIPNGENKLSYTSLFPAGIVVGITPFNFPLNLILHKFIPALIAKAPFILKPAPQTPFTALKLAKLIEKTCLPKECLQVLPCSNETAEYLCTHPLVSIISFTGSSKTGWHIKKIASEKKVLLECGGMASIIAEPDAEIQNLTRAIIKGGLGYSGQTCISVQSAYIHESIYEEVKKTCTDLFSKQSFGDPKNPDCLASCLINKTSTIRVKQWIDEAIKSGATYVIKTQPGLLDCPAVLLENVSPDMTIMSEEIFGPVVSLVPYKKIDNVIKSLNNSHYGLQHGLFTQSIHTIQHVYSNLETGGLIVNESPTWRVDNMPYGGIKKSGNTKEGIQYTVKDFSYEKLCVIKTHYES